MKQNPFLAASKAKNESKAKVSIFVFVSSDKRIVFIAPHPHGGTQLAMYTKGNVRHCLVNFMKKCIKERY